VGEGGVDVGHFSFRGEESGRFFFFLREER